ncbi:MAG: hypothetical protein DRI34_05585 [Deltaproteobacteria bacterium]|nr:MAG: hypothetical protein DRI34_05585 [Deltaproteobacteria bacterium]
MSCRSEAPAAAPPPRCRRRLSRRPSLSPTKVPAGKRSCPYHHPPCSYWFPRGNRRSPLW